MGGTIGLLQREEQPLTIANSQRWLPITVPVPVENTMPTNAIMDQLRAYLRPSEPWDAWLAKTGESPPDFAAMPSIPWLPNPLTFAKRSVCDATGWTQQRELIRTAFVRWVIGTYPDPPGNVQARTISERTEASGVRVREVELSFGPERRAKLRCELVLPPGPGPFPVFMTQRNHVGWARIAAARGYAAVVYNGCDHNDDTQAFKEVWPEHDWSMLCRRAWAAGRALDWLHTLPEIDRAHACITGHSRNGKLALICGAIEQRFDVVISSSSGIGGASPYRLANEAQFSEGIEILTWKFTEWFHPRLRFFAGREDKLPVDANLLIALSAPRAVLVSSALNDPCESAYANEMAVASASAVWALHGTSACERLALMWRPGGHETRAEVIERFVDWCDLHFGRVSGARADELRVSFQAPRHFPYTFASWRERSGERIDPAAYPPAKPLSPPPDANAWLATREDRRRRIRFLLGEEPATASRPPGKYGVEPSYMTTLLHRVALKGDRGFERHHFSFGEYVQASVYAPPGTVPEGAMPALSGSAGTAATRGPAVVWLHPESDASGYPAAYLLGTHMPVPMAQAGMTVITYDQIGAGARLPEAAAFYRRYPRWSIIGKMVRDALAAAAAARELPFVDPQRVFVCGFGIGGTVAALAGALDQRIAGVAMVSGFSPLRAERPDGPTGGLARYATWDGRGFLPRLGFFAERAEDAARVPIDFDEILSEIAPRPLLCIAPALDREADHAAVRTTLDAVSGVYAAHGGREHFWRHEPIDHRRFSQDIQAQLYAALARAMGLSTAAAGSSSAR
jgi:dienelactone hydrolase